MARLNNENVNHIKMEEINSLSYQGIPEKISNRCGLLHAIDNSMCLCAWLKKAC